MNSIQSGLIRHYLTPHDAPQQQKKPRNYQLEAVQMAYRQNTLVYLPTGAGKTYIAVLLAVQMINQGAKKKICFLTPTVALAIQQAGYFRQQSSLRVKEFYGEMSTSGIRKAIEENQVIVSTAQFFFNILIDDKWKMEDVALLIFDEAHNAIKGHPFNKLMQAFYFSIPAEKRPKVLALTASPGAKQDFSGTCHEICRVCMNVNCTAFMPVIHREELNSYVSIPDVTFLPITVSDSESLRTTYLEEHMQRALSIVRSSFPLLIESAELPLVLSDEFAQLIRANISLLNKTELLRPDYLFVLRHFQLCREAFDALLDEGEKGFIARLNKLFEVLLIPNLASYFDETGVQIQDFVNKMTQTSLFIFWKTRKTTPISVFDSILVCSKFQELVRYLQSIEPSVGPTYNGIIFVQRRRTAVVMSHCLPKLGVFNKFKFGYLLGNRKKTSKKPNEVLDQILEEYDSEDEDEVQVETEPISTNMTSSRQREILDQFRSHKINVLICTSVAEEGIDIPSCSHVIRYDNVSRMTAFVQSRGRARSKTGKFVILHRENSQEKAIIEKYLEQEPWMEEIVTALMNKVIECEDYLVLLRNPANDLRVAEQAVNILHHYHQFHSFAAPEMEVISLSKGYSCTTLYYESKDTFALHSTSQLFTEKQLAKKICCVEVLRLLQKKNKLDESSAHRFLSILGVEKLRLWNSQAAQNLTAAETAIKPTEGAEKFKSDISYKNRLQEYLQARFPSVQATYEKVRVDGPDHQPIFYMNCCVLKFKAQGAAPSKKTAEQKAAFHMLNFLQKKERETKLLL